MTGPLQQRFAEAFARAAKEPDYPVAQRPLDCARFALAGLVALEFARDEVTRLACGFGWTGYLRECGFDPGRAFDRHYRDGSMVVAFIPDLPRKGPLS